MDNVRRERDVEMYERMWLEKIIQERGMNTMIMKLEGR